MRTILNGHWFSARVLKRIITRLNENSHLLVTEIQHYYYITLGRTVIIGSLFYFYYW